MVLKHQVLNNFFGSEHRPVRSLLLFAILLCLSTSCKDPGQEFDTSVKEATIGDGVVRGSSKIYGMDIDLSTALITKQNDYKISEQLPYSYTFEYEDLNHTPKKQVIEGSISGESEVNASYYTLTLFEKTIGYDEIKKDMAGKGMAITFHIATDLGKPLSPTTFEGSSTVAPGTFHAYCSTRYDTNAGNRNYEVLVESGKLNITSMTATEITLSYQLKTENGSDLTGEYKGPYRSLNNQSPSNREGKDMKVYGYKDRIRRKLEGYDGNGKLIGKLNEKTYSVSILPSMLNLSATKVVTPLDANRAGLGSIDILLVADPEQDKTYILTPPIKHPAPIVTGWGRNKKIQHLIVPNYTKFMLAPDDFSEEDYRDADKKGFDFTVVDEVVRITEGEKKFVFFQTASGQKGILKITGSFPAKSEKTQTRDYETYKEFAEIEYPGGLIMDYKCFVSPVVPHIG